MKIASEQELHLDMSAVNPSALLVSAANGCCAGICAYNSDSFSAPGAARRPGRLFRSGRQRRGAACRRALYAAQGNVVYPSAPNIAQLPPSRVRIPQGALVPRGAITSLNMPPCRVQAYLIKNKRRANHEKDPCTASGYLHAGMHGNRLRFQQGNASRNHTGTCSNPGTGNHLGWRDHRTRCRQGAFRASGLLAGLAQLPTIRNNRSKPTPMPLSRSTTWSTAA